MADITYSISINTPDFKIKDELGNLTSSITTTADTIDIEYNNTLTHTNTAYTTSLMNYYSFKYIEDTAVSSVDGNLIKVEANSISVHASVPSEFTFGESTRSYDIVLNEWVPHNTYSSLRSRFYSTYRLYSQPSLQTYQVSSVSQTSKGFTYSDTAVHPIFFYRDNESIGSSSTLSTLSADSSRQYVEYYTDTISVETGYNFQSLSNNTSTIFSSTYDRYTTAGVEVQLQYNIDSNSVYTLNKSNINRTSWYPDSLVLNRYITNTTSWTTMTYYSTRTESTVGIIAGENGNVIYGSMSGLGQLIPLNGGVARPAIITSFSPVTDVGILNTIDTSWYGTYSARQVDSATSSTRDTYVEFNNYGVGGTISTGLYTWATSTLSSYSESSETSRAYLDKYGAYMYLDFTYPVVNRVTVNVSDNSCPFMSSRIENITSTHLWSSGQSGSTGYSSLIGTSSEAINLTLTSLYSTLGVEFNLMAYNDYVSKTNTYSAATTVISISNSTSFLEISETSSCDVTSYTSTNGYSYYTTFYGELVNETFYATSWINSAVVDLTTYTSVSSLTGLTLNVAYKTFGNDAHYTTIYEEKVLSSTSYSTRSWYSSKYVTSLDSYVEKDIDIPIEYYTTYLAEYQYVTNYTTYIGPNSNYPGYYNLNVLVTQHVSYTDSFLKDETHYTMSSLNTKDYGGITYRLSDLVSSSSRFNAGNESGTLSYVYNYVVKSMFSLNEFTTVLSNYNTLLTTTYVVPYYKGEEYNTYSLTKSSSLAVRSSGERFIDRVEISRTSTVSYGVTATIAMYNDSTMNTIRSSSTSYGSQEDREISTVARTFISSSGDFDISTEIVDSTTVISSRGSFIYSSRGLMSSTTEQQNDTLIFASTFNTYSFYNDLYTTSTLNTVLSTVSATTYGDWYNPVSWTSTMLSISTTTGSIETVYNSTGSVTVTQSINYTPVYDDVNGIYITN